MYHYLTENFHRQFMGLEKSELRNGNEFQARNRDPQDYNIQFFGGRNWEHAAEDLATIPPHQREIFVFCVFMTVITDQAIFTYYPQYYAKWRHVTQFPKFGWSGFGMHNENPYKLLWMPEKKRLIDPEVACDAMAEWVTQFIDLTHISFNYQYNTFDTATFFKNIMQDTSFQFVPNKNSRVLTAFRQQLIEQCAAIFTDSGYIALSDRR